MGCPVDFSMTGTRSSAGASLLNSVGLTELAAYSEADYVSLVLILRADPTDWPDYAAPCQRLLSSPLMDQVTATRHLEKALRDMDCTLQSASIPAAAKTSRDDRLEVSVSGGQRLSLPEHIDEHYRMDSLEQED